MVTAYFNDVSHPKFASTFREPCIVFTGHPTLRYGPVLHFLRMFGPSSRNSIIFTGNVTYK